MPGYSAHVKGIGFNTADVEVCGANAFDLKLTVTGYGNPGASPATVDCRLELEAVDQLILSLQAARHLMIYTDPRKREGKQ